MAKLVAESQLVCRSPYRSNLELPQFLLSKYQNKGIIGITQPRRVAAINLARRVAEEHGTHLRNKVSPSRLTLKIGWLFNTIRRRNDKRNPYQIPNRRYAPP